MGEQFAERISKIARARPMVDSTGEDFPANVSPGWLVKFRIAGLRRRGFASRMLARRRQLAVATAEVSRSFQ